MQKVMTAAVLIEAPHLESVMLHGGQSSGQT